MSANPTASSPGGVEAVDIDLVGADHPVDMDQALVAALRRDFLGRQGINLVEILCRWVRLQAWIGGLVQLGHVLLNSIQRNIQLNNLNHEYECRHYDVLRLLRESILYILV